MPLTSGTKLGPYEVTALIGQGGMGEVYNDEEIWPCGERVGV